MTVGSREKLQALSSRRREMILDVSTFLLDDILIMAYNYKITY